MAYCKKPSTEELKARERARYAKIKADQVLNELQKEKERKKYENKKVKLVADMTPRERRVNRKLWREKFRKHYQRKKCTDYTNIQLTPFQS